MCSFCSVRDDLLKCNVEAKSDRKLSLNAFILKVPTGCTRFHTSELQPDLLSPVLFWFFLKKIFYPVHNREDSDINLDNVSFKVCFISVHTFGEVI